MGNNFILFDTVKVRQESGLVNAYSPEDFLAITLSVRMKLILEQKVSFFMGTQQVPTRDALKHIRERTAALAA